MTYHYMTINGIRVPCRLTTSLRLTPIGGDALTMQGRARRLRGRRRGINIETPPMASDLCLAMHGLLSGFGDYCTFTHNLWGSAGLRGHSARDAGWTKVSYGFATGISAIQSGSGNVAVWASQRWRYKDRWTLLFNFRPNGGSWVHYAVDSDGNEHADGAPVAPFTVPAYAEDDSNGISKLFVIDSSTVGDRIATLLLVPYVMPTSWVQKVHDTHKADEHWSELPLLYASGDFVGGERKLVTGVSSITNAPAHFDGTFDPHAGIVQATLEVRP